MRSKIFLMLLCLILAGSLSAQELKVKSFWLNPQDITASATKTRKLDANGEVCALVKVRLAVSGCKFENTLLIESLQSGPSEYWVYMSPEATRLKINAPGFLPMTVEFSDYEYDELESRCTYILEIEKPVIFDEKAPLMKPNGFYLGGSYVIGGLSGAAAHIGATYRNIDLELSYRFGLSASDPVNWYTDAADVNTFTSRAEYKLSSFAVKLGYQLNAHRRLAIVPQIGMSIHSLSATLLEGTELFGDGSKCANATLGVKAIWSPMRRIAVFASPEYAIPVKKTETYGNIADAGGFTAGGFSCNMGILFHF